MTDDALAPDGGVLTPKVFEFLRRMERLVNEAEAGVSSDHWAPLTEMVAVDDFQRYVPADAFGSGDDMAAWSASSMGWARYLDLFNGWGPVAPHYSNRILRIAEFPGLVYLEIEEHHGERTFESLSVYEFDDGGLIRGIRVASAAGSLVVPTDA